jgi:glycine/D-amino acid oxidase-like deaminating enzyme
MNRPHEAWADSKFEPLWLDTVERPALRPRASRHACVDLLVVGGGFTGLWTALRAVERDPNLKVLLIESDRIAEHASGRNGGFCDASITHGRENGLARWPEEYATLHRIGQQNLADIERTVRRYGIDCGFARVGVLTVATRPHEVAALEPDQPGFLNAQQVRDVVDSPTYLAGRVGEGSAIVDPARLAWGLASAAEQMGVEIAENTSLRSFYRVGERIHAVTSNGTIDAKQVALATNVFPNPLRRLRLAVVPVYDYVLATQPLTPQQLESIGWDPTISITDSGNQFHYYRLTPDNRILFGGYDAIYHYGRSIKAEHYDRPESFDKLARHFAETFPQLDGIKFTHRWSGVIDTSTRFCPFFGTAYDGQIAYATGFTGLGVGASRFAADVMLDLLSGISSERTSLRMVRTKPLPFPPEPFAWIGIQLTRWAMARADRTGRRNLWLRLLDRLGLGFDS